MIDLLTGTTQGADRREYDQVAPVWQHSAAPEYHHTLK